jgi:hypothetical protein
MICDIDVVLSFLGMINTARFDSVDPKKVHYSVPVLLITKTFLGVMSF